MLDIAAGCVGALGTLAALWARHQSGQGQRVFTSLAAVSAFVQSAELTTYDGRPPRPVGGPDFAGPSLWRRLYKAADRWFAVAAATDEQRDAFLDVVGQSGPPATEDDAQIDTISRTIEQRPCDEWLDLLDAAGVPACAAINRFEMDHPFLVDHRYSHIVDTPHVGRLEIVGGYTDWHGVDRLPPLPVDELRADEAAVLARWSEVASGRS
jgi:crotonobetainyl-CoA:carnitine CoA-transferase CaiB-like acyl-CoA transferase